MPQYKYTVMDKTGKKTTNIYSASTENEVIYMLRENNYTVLKINEIKKNDSIPFLSRFSKVTSKDLSLFCRQFQAMLNAGVPIINCLDIINQQTENKKLRKTIGGLFENLQKGFTFSEALKKYSDIFPQIFVNMVEAGEISGNLDTIMDRLAIHFEKEYKIENKVKGAMVYPIILLVVSVTVLVFLLTNVMPTFIGLYESSGVSLPLPTKIMLAMSDFVRFRWYILIGLIILIIIIFKTFSKNESTKMKTDELKLKIPVLKNVSLKLATSRFTRTLSTLLGSGVPLMNALEIVAKVTGNRFIGESILNAKEQVRKGVGLAEPLKQRNLFPPMVTSMIQIGEDSGALDEMLAKTADFYDEEVDVAINKLTTILEPLMIVIMAVFIGFIVIAMVMPMFDMVSTI